MATGVDYSHKYYINGLDLWLTFGIVVERGNLAELERVPSRKEQWMNNWPDEDGTERYTKRVYFESKQMNLNFVFICENKSDYLRNSSKFKEFITIGGASGYFELDCILNRKKYKLLYSGNDAVEVLTPINSYPFANAVARYSFNVVDDLLTGVLGGTSDMIDADQFISVWDTRNVTAGSSATNSIRLPLTAGVSDFYVNWGDGTPTQHITDNQAQRTYITGGVYTVTIKGYVRGFRFNNSGDRNKIIEIKNWGGLIFDNYGMFDVCENINLSNVNGTPIIESSRLQSQFSFNKQLTSIKNLRFWNTSKVTDVGFMFDSSDKFDGIGISNLDISKVNKADSFMFNASADFLKTNTLDSIYLSWSKQQLQRNVSISFGSAKYSAAGKVGRDILVTKFNWTITDGGII